MVAICGEIHARSEGAQTGAEGVDPTTDNAFDNILSGIDDIILENDYLPTSANETNQRANTMSPRSLWKRNRHSDALAAAMTQMASAIDKACSSDQLK